MDAPVLRGLGGVGGFVTCDWQFQSLNKGEKPPFPLNEFPEALGDWHKVEEVDALEPNARLSGSEDHR